MLLPDRLLALEPGPFLALCQINLQRNGGAEVPDRPKNIDGNLGQMAIFAHHRGGFHGRLSIEKRVEDKVEKNHSEDCLAEPSPASFIGGLRVRVGVGVGCSSGRDCVHSLFCLFFLPLFFFFLLSRKMSQVYKYKISIVEGHISNNPLFLRFVAVSTSTPSAPPT